MELVTHQQPASTQKHGEDGDVVIPSGKRLVIETSPAGVELLNATVPAGKQWIATISVNITETDA